MPEIELKRYEYKGYLTSGNFNEKSEEIERYLNELLDSINNNQRAFETRISEIVQEFQSYKSDVTLAVETLKRTIYTKNQTDELIQNIIGSAPEALDTLQEISKALGNDKNFATTITKELAKKVNKVDGKVLSTNDFTNELKDKLKNIENNANNYIHPDKHNANMIIQDASHRFVTDEEKARWDIVPKKGEKGDTGARGATGERGPIGERGPQGIQGAVGPQGPIGQRGATGATGAKGEDGATFIPSLDSSGNLSWINNKNLQNPVTVNIKGPQGIQGTRGPAGPQGQKGDTGARGPVGERGPQGIQGTVGPQGPIGQRGATGATGAKGEDGATFIPSLDSSGNLSWINNKNLSNPVTVNIKGPQGIQGTRGPAGPQGQKGDTGARGPVGERGPQGPVGPRGPAGEIPNINELKKILGFVYAKNITVLPKK